MLLFFFVRRAPFVVFASAPRRHYLAHLLERPDLDGAVERRARERRRVFDVDDRRDEVAVLAEPAERLARLDVPQRQHEVDARAQQRRAVLNRRRAPAERRLRRRARERACPAVALPVEARRRRRALASGAAAVATVARRRVLRLGRREPAAAVVRAAPDGDEVVRRGYCDLVAPLWRAPRRERARARVSGGGAEAT